ncbi:T-complex protein 1 subunit delta-like [Anneissia japonica]|uniref:T-complex protein 1 subunit delta-like n=1 Tax=Anneissia japonica TaxID=1529436 RepID=UPI001425AC0E|nr:T-complex protein 1 subunit delta-like [Anneissia japonica]
MEAYCIKKAGCIVLLIQKSILRDTGSDLALHFLAKMKIAVIKDIELSDMEFICKSIGCKPVAIVYHILPETIVYGKFVEEVVAGTSKDGKITGSATPGKTVTVLLRGSNKLVIEGAERSIHNALRIICFLIENKVLITSGGALETEVAYVKNMLASWNFLKD